MTPEQYAEMQKSHIAPCGCRVEFGRDEHGHPQQSCLHGDDCALKVAPEPKKGKSK